MDKVIRKNSKLFKALKNVFLRYQSDSNRAATIYLFIVPPGKELEEKIAVEDLGEEAAIYYDLNYKSILDSFEDPVRVLHYVEEEQLFYFASSSFKTWTQTPFRLEASLFKRLDEFEKISGLQVEDEVTRIRPAVKKPVTRGSSIRKGIDIPGKLQAESDAERKRSKRYKMLEELQTESPIRGERLFVQPPLNEKDLLEYYENPLVEKAMAHFVKNRVLSLKIYSQRPIAVKKELFHSLDTLYESKKYGPSDFDELQGRARLWSTTHNKIREHIVCKSQRDILALVKKRFVEVHPWMVYPSKEQFPDYLVLNLNAENAGIKKAVLVAQATAKLLRGFQLPVFIKTSEKQGFHFLLPLKGKSDYGKAKSLAEFLVWWIHKILPELTTVNRKNVKEKDRVYLDVSQNIRAGSIIAPYSLIDRYPEALVSAPVKEEELKEGFDHSAFTPVTMIKRLKENEDLFATFKRQSIDAGKILQRLEALYGFLLN